MAVAEAGSDVGDLNTLVGVHWAACGPGDGLNSGLSGQRAAAAVETQPSLHRVTVCSQPQRTLQKLQTWERLLLCLLRLKLVTGY